MVAWQLRLLAVAFALSTTSCAGFLLRQDVESARADWQITPTGQRAVIYAEALHDAFVGRAYVDQTADFRQRADEALSALGAAESRGGPQLPTLIADRGLLLLDLGRNHEGWAELQRSMALAPTLAAARGIVSVWGARGRNDEVGDACARTLPAMRDAASRFQLLDLCVKNSTPRPTRRRCRGRRRRRWRSIATSARDRPCLPNRQLRWLPWIKPCRPRNRRRRPTIKLNRRRRSPMTPRWPPLSRRPKWPRRRPDANRDLARNGPSPR